MMIWCFLLVVGAAARQFDMTDDLFGSHDLENSDFLEHIFFGEFFNANHTEELLLDLGPLCGDTIDCDYAFVKSWTLFVQFKPSGLTTFIPLNHRAFFHSKIAGNGPADAPPATSPLTDWSFQIAPWEMSAVKNYFYIVSAPGTDADHYFVTFRLERAHTIQLGAETHVDLTAADHMIDRYFIVNVPWPLGTGVDHIGLSIETTRPSDWNPKCISTDASTSETTRCLAEYFSSAPMVDRYAISPFPLCLASDLAKEHHTAGCEYLSLKYAERVASREPPHTVQQTVCLEAGFDANCIVGTVLVQLDAVWSGLAKSDKSPSSVQSTRVNMAALCNPLKGTPKIACFNAIGRFEEDIETTLKTLQMCELITTFEEESFKMTGIEACLHGLIDVQIESILYTPRSNTAEKLLSLCTPYDSLSIDSNPLVPLVRELCYTAVGRAAVLFYGYHVELATLNVCNQMAQGQQECTAGASLTTSNRDPDAYLDGICDDSPFSTIVTAVVASTGINYHFVDNVFESINVTWRAIEETAGKSLERRTVATTESFAAAVKTIFPSEPKLIPLFLKYSSRGAEFTTVMKLEGLVDHMPTTAVVQSTSIPSNATFHDQHTASDEIHSRVPVSAIVVVVLAVVALIGVIGVVLWRRHQKIKPVFA